MGKKKLVYQVPLLHYCGLSSSLTCESGSSALGTGKFEFCSDGSVWSGSGCGGGTTNTYNFDVCTSGTGAGPTNKCVAGVEVYSSQSASCFTGNGGGKVLECTGGGTAS